MSPIRHQWLLKLSPFLGADHSCFFLLCRAFRYPFSWGSPPQAPHPLKKLLYYETHSPSEKLRLSLFVRGKLARISFLIDFLRQGVSLFFIYWYFLWKSISINDILLPIRFNFEFIQFLKCGKDIRGVESDLWTELSNKKTPKSLSLRCKLVPWSDKHFLLFFA